MDSIRAFKLAPSGRTRVYVRTLWELTSFSADRSCSGGDRQLVARAVSITAFTLAVAWGSVAAVVFFRGWVSISSFVCGILILFLLSGLAAIFLGRTPVKSNSSASKQVLMFPKKT